MRAHSRSSWADELVVVRKTGTAKRDSDIIVPRARYACTNSAWKARYLRGKRPRGRLGRRCQVRWAWTGKPWCWVVSGVLIDVFWKQFRLELERFTAIVTQRDEYYITSVGSIAIRLFPIRLSAMSSIGKGCIWTGMALVKITRKARKIDSGKTELQEVDRGLE